MDSKGTTSTTLTEEPVVHDELETAEELFGQPSTYLLPLRVAIALLAFSHSVAAIYAPIQDCDETFNYWEPLHYLVNGYGLQTWEYSPEFSIRSWAYILLHAIPTKVAAWLGTSKHFQFYLIRFMLALASAGSELRLYAAISRTLNARMGIFYLAIASFTPGFFYASAAFLPSSFSMIMCTLGLSAYLDERGPQTSIGIFVCGVGAMLGWPFAGALILPFVFGDWSSALIHDHIPATLKLYLKGIVRCLVVLALIICIDGYFYKQFTIVPWRIVAYNIFGGQGRGPEIFGTEPWTYYFKNLLLNFNIWFVLAMSVAPILAIQRLCFERQTGDYTVTRSLVLTSPFYLWFLIFTAQAHKEERFMFPAYPFLALNASIALFVLLGWVGNTDMRTRFGRISPEFKMLAVLTIMLVSLNVGFLRILGTISGYQAPLQIYQGLEMQRAASPDTVCFGKDWYRFPSSFQLPDGVHAKFIKSEFDGLLPGEFREDNTGTYTVPAGMNDRNIEDPGKYVNVTQCTYLVDSYFASAEPTALEPVYALSKEWEPVMCAQYLDVGATSLLARTIWVPQLPFLPKFLQRVWGEHCLLRQRRS